MNGLSLYSYNFQNLNGDMLIGGVQASTTRLSGQKMGEIICPTNEFLSFVPKRKSEDRFSSERFGLMILSVTPYQLAKQLFLFGSSKIAFLIHRLIDRRRIRKERSQLMAMTELELKDIGLTRLDALQEYRGRRRCSADATNARR